MIEIDNSKKLGIDRFAKHMWINRWNSHTTNKSSKQEGACAHNDFYAKKNSIVLFYKGCVVETSGFRICVSNNEEEFMMVASLRFLTCTNN